MSAQLQLQAPGLDQQPSEPKRVPLRGTHLMQPNERVWQALCRVQAVLLMLNDEGCLIDRVEIESNARHPVIHLLREPPEGAIASHCELYRGIGDSQVRVARADVFDCKVEWILP